MRPVRDSYEVLGVARDADEAAIRAAFRALAARHPDRLPPETAPEVRALATARFKEITEAYQILSDETERGKYDRCEDPYQVDPAAGDLIPPDVAAVVDFAKEAGPEIVTAVKAAWTDEPLHARAIRVAHAAGKSVLDLAKTPDGQAQIRAIARGLWDRFLKLDAAAKP